MNLLGYTDLQIFEPQPQEAAGAAYAAMPSWPAPGAVARFGVGFLVKLSPPINPFTKCGGWGFPACRADCYHRRVCIPAITAA